MNTRQAGCSMCAAARRPPKTLETVFVVRRVLDYGGEPAVLDDITLPATLFKGLTRARIEAYRGSMYGFFETQFGVRMLRAQERLKAIAADSATAAILKVRTGEPLLAVERLTRTYGERPVEWRRGLCSTRRHYYLNELG
jgi:GntR family transcriptional regulator